MKLRFPWLALAAVLALSVSGTAQSRVRPRPNPIRQCELEKGTSSLGSVARTLLLQQQSSSATRNVSTLGAVQRRAALLGGSVNYMRTDKRIHPPRTQHYTTARR